MGMRAGKPVSQGKALQELSDSSSIIFDKGNILALPGRSCLAIFRKDPTVLI